ncbi:MAG TPA: DUF4476 domain-containing protein [Chitinophagaceae bacterium]
MNKLLLSLFFAVLTVNAFSQRVYFVYLQTEQEQPFFVRMNERVYSSSESGYLILSKLKDSTYNLSIGFPKEQWPEQKFTVTVRAKDYGYLLKNFGEKGWGLFDLQTLAVQMAASSAKEASTQTGSSNVSDFTNILAKAADDASLKEKPVTAKTEEKTPPKTEIAKIEEKKPAATPVVTDTIATLREQPKAEVKETIAAKLPEPIASLEAKKEPAKTEIKDPLPEKKEELKKEPGDPISNITSPNSLPAKETEYIPSVVTRRSESSTTEGFGLTFIDQFANGARDTISILIPNTKVVVSSKEAPRQEKKFLDITTDTATVSQPALAQVKKEEPKVDVKQPVVTDTIATSKPVLSTTTNCKEVAEEADFLKLRKAMAATETDDDMLDEARKYFKAKCFTSQQVRNLSVLFLNEAGKYKFFDQAYSYVSDISNFPSLQSELKEEYYINRFKAMLRN